MFLIILFLSFDSNKVMLLFSTSKERMSLHCSFHPKLYLIPTSSITMLLGLDKNANRIKRSNTVLSKTRVSIVINKESNSRSIILVIIPILYLLCIIKDSNKICMIQIL